FEDAGHELTVIEKEQGNTVTGKNGEAKVKVDASIDDVNPDNFDALFIPGGFSPDMLRADERFVEFAKAFMDKKKLVLTLDRKSTRLNSSHVSISYAVFCLKHIRYTRIC